MSKTIIIVDDDPAIVIALQFLMEQHGYNVMTAESGEVALELTYKYKPDAILGGGPQRLDHLRGELSYSQKLKIIQTSGSLSERMG